MKVLLFIIFLLPYTVFAQKNADPRLQKFGKISNLDFQPTFFDESGFDAVLLQYQKFMYFDDYQHNLKLHHVYHIRMKVLKDGFRDDDFFTVNFSGRFEYEQVVMNRCAIYSKKGEKIVAHKIKYKNFNTIDRDSMESRVKFTLPELHRGDVIDWEFSLVTFDFMMPPLWKFNQKYPCVASALVTNFPEFMTYKFDLKGSDTLAIKRKTSSDFVNISYFFSPSDNPSSMLYMQPRRAPVFNINYKFRSILDSFVVFNTLPIEFLNESNQRVSKMYGTSSLRMKAAQFTQNIGYQGLHYTAWQQFTHLLYVYADPDNREIHQMEAWNKIYNAGYIIVDSHDWEILHKRQWKNPDFWKRILKNCPTAQELSYLNDPDEVFDTLTIAKKVFEFVSKTMTWNGKFDNHSNRNLEAVYKEKSGNSAEINMLLVSMLRRFGTNAFPVMVATKDFGEVDTNYANIQQFNTILAAIELGQKSSDGLDTYLLMDATIKTENIYDLPDNDLNGIGWAVGTDKQFFIEITNNTENRYNAKFLYIFD